MKPHETCSPYLNSFFIFPDLEFSQGSCIVLSCHMVLPFWCTGQCSNQLNHMARASSWVLLFKKNY